MINNSFYKQVELLISVIPIVNEETIFALKGGTAINLFLRDLPRLSVDIDLTYTEIKDRATSFKEIEEALKRIAAKLPLLNIKTIEDKNPEGCKRLTCSNSYATIIVEVDRFIRGTVYKPELRVLSPKASQEFKKFAEINCSSFPDIYGGKICAALERQHPRDLFDVKILLENEGVTEEIRQAFIIYLISSENPISHLLSPNMPNENEFTRSFENKFKGMTNISVDVKDLIKTRDQLIKTINSILTEQEKHFLVSFQNGTPNWDLLATDIGLDMPSVVWKLFHINQMSLEKKEQAVSKLKEVLQRSLI
jgi:predicted nucleotidyltransferase component of viral defense system